MGGMEALPEHQQPSPDVRIVKWVGVFAALTAAAVLVRRSRALADD